MAWPGRVSEQDTQEAQVTLDLAYEDAYRIAKRVRDCPHCHEGWEPVEEYEPNLRRKVERMRHCTHCNWYEEWRHVMGQVRNAKREYRRLNECEPPEPMKDAPIGSQPSLSFFAVNPAPPSEERQMHNLVEVSKIMCQLKTVEKSMELDAVFEEVSP